MSTKKITISFTIPSPLHLAIGAALTLTALAAFALHYQIPPTSHLSLDTLIAGAVLSCITLAYWLWCCIQGDRGEVRELRKEILKLYAEIIAIRQDASAHDAHFLAAMEEIGNLLGTLADAVDSDGGSIKGLHNSIADAIGAIEALQDCYTVEGRVLVLPAIESGEVPRDTALSRMNRPRPIQGGADSHTSSVHTQSSE